MWLQELRLLIIDTYREATSFFREVPALVSSRFELACAGANKRRASVTLVPGGRHSPFIANITNKRELFGEPYTPAHA
jgi:hypothetical protein